MTLVPAQDHRPATKMNKFILYSSHLALPLHFNTQTNMSSLKDKTAKGLFWGALSNGLMQGLNLLFGIVLGRLLTESDYGMVGMLTIFSTIAGALQEGGFISALTNRKNTAHEDYNAVFWFSLAVSLLLYGLLFAAAPFIADFYGTPELTPLARVVFLGFVISCLGLSPRAYLFKNLKVKQYSFVTLGALALSGAVGITLAASGFAYWGLALQSLTYVTAVMLLNFHFSGWRPTLSFTFRPIREMVGFSSKMVITNVCNIVNNNLFSVILGKCYTEREVGSFTQANKWNSMGYTFVSGMIAGVAQPVLASVAGDPERRLTVFRKMLRFAAFVSFPVMLGLSLVAEELIVIAITEKWLASASMMRILCVWGAFVPIVTLFTNFIVSCGKSNTYMWGTVTQILVQLAVALLAYPHGLDAMLLLFTGVNVAWLFVWFALSRRDLGLSFSALLRDLAPYLLLSLLLCFAAEFTLGGIADIYLRFGAKIIVVAATYVGILQISGSTILKESCAYLRKKK